MDRSIQGSSRTFIFDFLVEAERHALLADCTNVPLDFGEVLYEAPMLVEHVYFPTSGFISLVKILEDGSSMEVGMVGREGLVGSELNTADGIATITAVVQGQGSALRIGMPAFQAQLKHSPSLRAVVQEHSSYRMRQMAQTIVCTRFHFMEQRLARWLLMTSERAGSTRFAITHEFLAYMLGTRRAGVTLALGELRTRSLIAYRRSEIEIIDVPGLMSTACSCINTDLEIYRNELLPHIA